MFMIKSLPYILSRGPQEGSSEFLVFCDRNKSQGTKCLNEHHSFEASFAQIKQYKVAMHSHMTYLY